ncbi:Transcription antitermination factor NusG [Rhodoblastus acidophilus]|uniref:Transcription antitermination factor NusG n=1 Tax=Rhodoblastus acidophilus TaxID=1074 RepID=A0A212SCF3_RHOAC|nr:transcription termination/antitermination NusG family protein [Rhodoblastus acidophilus]SNB83084.1 Transcription antitermination factor NusG [Rhodoblastus acidophilus]
MKAKAGEGKKIQARRVAERPSGVAWYVADVFDNREKVAAQALKLKGFRVFAPTRSRVATHARRIELREDALFPGYIFVGVPAGADMSEARHADYVEGLVGRPDPVELDADVIAKFARACALGEFDTLPQPRRAGKPFEIGDEVVVKDGPFAGAKALVQQFRRGGAAELLLDFFGQKRAVVLRDVARVVELA